MSIFTFNAVLVDVAVAPQILGTPGENAVTVTIDDINGSGGTPDFLIDGDEQHLSFTFNSQSYDVTGTPLYLTGTASLWDNDGVLQHGSFFIIEDTDLADVLRPLMPEGTTLPELIPVFIPDDQSASFTVGGDGILQGLTTPEAPFVCFGEQVRIQTNKGSVSCADLMVGDRIMTRRGTFEAIRWIGRRDLTEWDFCRDERLRPVRICAGALGNGLPLRDMLVSRQHRMVVSSVISERVTGHPDTLIPAIRLTELRGIEIAQDVTKITYTHLLLDQHEVVFAEGAPTESLYLGTEALAGLTPDARQEISSLFPEVDTPGFLARPACELPSGQAQKQIVRRHVKNNKSLLQAFRSKPATVSRRCDMV